MQSFKNRSIATLGAVFATVITVVAATPVRAEGREARVSYADLDLRSAAGAATLEHRIALAASRVCRSSDAAMHRQVALCRRDAASRARTGIPADRAPVQIAAR